MEQAVDLCKCKKRVYRPDSITDTRLAYIDYLTDLSFLDAIKQEIENGESTKNGKKQPYVSEFMTYDTETTTVSRETLWLFAFILIVANIACAVIILCCVGTIFSVVSTIYLC